MKILVPVKRVIDPYVRIRVKPDHTGVETATAKMGMNPFDEIAVEAAVQLKEAGHASELIAVTIGEAICQETLRTALALGIDRAILIQTNQTDLEPINIAKILKIIVNKEAPRLVILGKQAIDGDNNQTGQMLSALLNWPQGTFASKLEIAGEEILVTREIDGGLETIALTLPAVITTDLRLNQPRYATLPNIMKAKQKPLEIISLDNLNLSLKSHTQLLEVLPPQQRRAGIRVDDVKTLVEKLRSESQVI